MSPASWQRAIDDGLDPGTMSDNVFAQYADMYYEYEPSTRASRCGGRMAVRWSTH
ncbi:MAG: hypothetical protein WKF77_22705 [Planctomycetaceae bacterium]